MKLKKTASPMWSKKMCKISIIIPAYNIENYLPRALDSVIAQTWQNLEIIVVNDGSIDQTGKIIDEYAKRDVRIIPVHKANGGASSARNAGIAVSTGEYIGFVDGDDIIEPEMYETLLKNAKEYDADISHCGYQMEFPSRVDYYYNTGVLKVQSCNEGISALLLGKEIEPSASNKLYRREIVLEAHFDEEIRNNEDMLFNAEVFSKAKATVFYDLPFYHYMVRENSLATSKLSISKIYDPITVRERILVLFEKDAEILPFAFMRYISTVINIYNTILKSGVFKDELPKIRSLIVQNKDKLDKNPHVSQKTRLYAKFIIGAPWVYGVAFPVLHKFSKNKDRYKVK